MSINNWHLHFPVYARLEELRYYWKRGRAGFIRSYPRMDAAGKGRYKSNSLSIIYYTMHIIFGRAENGKFRQACSDEVAEGELGNRFN